MEMERINENTIRVSIGNEDLEERGITFLDLLGNQKQIESFFYSILEEVDVEEQFQETDSVTFQVLPNHDGLELFISKNLPMSGSDELSEMAANIEDSGFTDFLKDQLISQEKPEKISAEDMEEVMDYIDEALIDQKNVVFSFDEFEDVVRLAKNVRLHNVSTNLYHFKDHYFLHVVFYLENTTEYQVKNDMSLLYEYSNKTNVTPDVLDEYGDLIMERSAIELLRYYFK